MREFWIKVLNYIISIMVKDIFEQIKIFYYWRGSVALMDPPWKCLQDQVKEHTIQVFTFSKNLKETAFWYPPPQVQ